MIATAFLAWSLFLGSALTHQDYSEKAVLGYIESNHGPDGALFLDPFFTPDIENLNGEKILDAGCGAAPWAIYAAIQGGEVYGLDIQHAMIHAAKKAIEAAQLTDNISIIQGDVTALPYKDLFFDKALSICVACNLPTLAFETHFSELARTLKEDGAAIIAAPHSLEIVFSNDTTFDSEVLSHIQTILAELPDDPSSELISEKLSGLEEVLSATFCLKKSRLSLVTDQKEVQKGEKIWRKLPKAVVANHYYVKEDYLDTFKKYHLEVQKIDAPSFIDENERIAHNAKTPLSSLGKAYRYSSPFVIFHVRKKVL